MSDDNQVPKYACPHCGCREFCTTPDEYSIYLADGDELLFQRTELCNDGIRLSCRECGEDAPAQFAEAAR